MVCITFAAGGITGTMVGVATKRTPTLFRKLFSASSRFDKKGSLELLALDAVEVDALPETLEDIS